MACDHAAWDKVAWDMDEGGRGGTSGEAGQYKGAGGGTGGGKGEASHWYCNRPVLDRGSTHVQYLPQAQRVQNLLHKVVCNLQRVPGRVGVHPA